VFPAGQLRITALRGPAAAAHARAMMEQAGIDVAELNKLIGGGVSETPAFIPSSYRIDAPRLTGAGIRASAHPYTAKAP
jgi:hypothetical protein